MKPVDRRIKRLPSDSVSGLESWALPDVAGEHVMAFARKETGQIEVIEEEQVAEKLTLAELEEIRESARREGFDEGYKDGLEKGLGDGHAKGLADGHKEGYDAGFASGQGDVQRLQAQLTDLIQQQHDPLRSQAENLENHLLDMVVSLSRAVVGDTAQIDKAVVRRAVQEVLSKIPRPHAELKIMVNPADVEVVAEMARLQHETWQIVGDDSIAQGGCRLHGVDNFADNTLPHRFDQVVEQFQSFREVPATSDGEPA